MPADPPSIASRRATYVSGRRRESVGDDGTLAHAPPLNTWLSHIASTASRRDAHSAACRRLFVKITRFSEVRVSKYETRLCVFGVDQYGYSVSMIVDDFRPDFLLRCPESWGDTEAACLEEFSDLQDEITGAQHENQPSLFHKAVFEQRTHTIGFTNHRKDAFIRVYASSIDAYRRLVRILSDPSGSYFTQGVRLFHHETWNMSPFSNKFLLQKGISYAEILEVRRPLRVCCGPRDARLTRCNVEVCVRMDGLVKVENVDAPIEGIRYPLHPAPAGSSPSAVAAVPEPFGFGSMLTMCIRIKCVSRDAVFDGGTDTQEFAPDPTLKFDRILAIALCMTRVDDPSNTPVMQHMLTIIPPSGTKRWSKTSSSSVTDPSYVYNSVDPSEWECTHCETERDLVAAYARLMCEYDPDFIFMYPDQTDDFAYITERAQRLFAGGGGSSSSTSSGSSSGTRVSYGRSDRPTTVACHVDRVIPSEYNSGSVYARYRDDEDGVERCTGVTFNTREMVSTIEILRSDVMVQIEVFDLYETSKHPAIRKAPDHYPSHVHRPYLPNVWYRYAHEAARLREFGLDTSTFCGYDLILDSAAAEATLIRRMEADKHMVMEMFNVSRVARVPAYSTVMRGQTYRAKHLIADFSIEKGRYVDLERIEMAPLRFSIRERPPTHGDPPEPKMNIDFRNEQLKKLETLKLRQLEQMVRAGLSGAKTLTNARVKLSEAKAPDLASIGIEYGHNKQDSDDDDDNDVGHDGDAPQYMVPRIRKRRRVDDPYSSLLRQTRDERIEPEEDVADTDVKEGGNVVNPTPGFFYDNRLGVLDFKSLYPSIMIWRSVCYSTQVLEREYLDCPGVEYTTVRINKSETSTFAYDKDAILPELLRRLLAARGVAKKQMKEAKTPFEKQAKNSEQASLKVMCNGVYGFTGASTGPMYCRDMMFQTTALGRYLQKITTEWLAKFGIYVVYGDTDSVFVMFPIHETISGDSEVEKTVPIEEIARHMGRIYRMDGYLKDGAHPDGVPFTWENAVMHWNRRLTHRKSESQLASMDRAEYDIRHMTKSHQVNALVYLAAEKLCDAMNREIFSAPVELEFENMSTQSFFGKQKKYYFYLFWDEGHPAKVAKTKIQGMPAKKRDWCPYTRETLKTMIRYMTYPDAGVTRKTMARKISDYVEQRLNKLVSRDVAVTDLQVSKNYKGKLNYRSHDPNRVSQAVYNLCMRNKKRTRKAIPADTRVYHVIKRGKEAQYMRGEDPWRVKVEELDIEYYVRKQMIKPIMELCVYFADVVDLPALFNKYLSKWKRIESGMGCITDIFGSSSSSSSSSSSAATSSAASSANGSVTLRLTRKRRRRTIIGA